MQTENNHSAAAQVLAAAPKDGYKVTAATAKLLDCLRAGSAYYDMIHDAMQQKYGGIMSPAEAEAKAQPYLDVINDIAEMLHDEITGSVVDALSDVQNTTADCIRI